MVGEEALTGLGGDRAIAEGPRVMEAWGANGNNTTLGEVEPDAPATCIVLQDAEDRTDRGEGGDRDDNVIEKEKASNEDAEKGEAKTMREKESVEVVKERGVKERAVGAALSEPTCAPNSFFAAVLDVCAHVSIECAEREEEAGVDTLAKKLVEETILPGLVEGLGDVHANEEERGGGREED